MGSGSLYKTDSLNSLYFVCIPKKWLMTYMNSTSNLDHKVGGNAGNKNNAISKHLNNIQYS